MDPRGADGGVLEAFLDDGARLVDEARDLLGGWWLKHELSGAAVDEVGRAGSESTGPGPPVASKDPIVQADEELAIPPEGHVVGAAQDEAHRLPIAEDERRVLLPDLIGAVAGQDVVNLLDGDRYALHGGRGRDGLCFQVPAKTAGPGPWDRPSIVEEAPPAVQLAGQILKNVGGIWQHDLIVPLIS